MSTDVFRFGAKRRGYIKILVVDEELWENQWKDWRVKESKKELGDCDIACAVNVAIV